MGLALRTRSLNEIWYNGYREQNMLGVFIALWCAVSYFAKVEPLTQIQRMHVCRPLTLKTGERERKRGAGRTERQGSWAVSTHLDVHVLI